jgi:hypothetical protein
VFHLHRGRMQAAMHGLRLDVLEKSVQQAQALAAGQGAVTCPPSPAGAPRISPSTEAILPRRSATSRTPGGLAPAGRPLPRLATRQRRAHIATELLLDPVTGRSWCRRALGQPRFLAFSQPHKQSRQLARAMAAMGELDAAARASAALPQDAISRRVLGFLDGSWEQTVTDCSTSLARDESAGGQARRAVPVALARRGTRHSSSRGTRATRVLRNALQVAANAPQAPSEVWLRAQLAQLVVAHGPGGGREPCTAVRGARRGGRGVGWVVR